jgi:quercetin dioxygenase-like cupin family protein
MESQRIAFEEIAWEILPSGVRSKVQSLGNKQLRLLEFGQDLDHPDWCLNGHIGYVLEGEMEVEFENNTLLFKTGDGIFIFAGEANRHRPRAITEKVCLIFVEDI